MKTYYDDGSVTIYHGDCREILPLVQTVDLIVTSPPYNLGTSSGGGFADLERNPKAKTGTWSGGALAKGYRGFRDNLPVQEYEAGQRAVLEACWAQLSPAGAIYYNHKPRVQDGIARLPFFADLPLRQVVVWHRGGGINFAPTHYLPSCEWIVLYAKAAFRLVQGAAVFSDVWAFPPESNAVGDHPAPFPLALPNRCIASTTAATVLDPFMGSGTTLRAAKDLGRKAIGIEIDERYCEIAATRMGQEVLPLEGTT